MMTTITTTTTTQTCSLACIFRTPTYANCRAKRPRFMLSVFRNNPHKKTTDPCRTPTEPHRTQTEPYRKIPNRAEQGSNHTENGTNHAEHKDGTKQTHENTTLEQRPKATPSTVTIPGKQHPLQTLTHPPSPP